MDSTHSIQNNSIVIQSDRKIKKEDLKFLYLYFQTANYSGGGSIDSFHFDDEKQRIYIKYEHDCVKRAVLNRRCLSYSSYNFQALDPLEINFTSEKNRRYLIIKNLKKTLDPTGIHLYLDYLAEKSSVNSATFSCIFDSTLYVRFNDDINFPLLQQKMLKIPDFDGKKIEIHEAYDTNKIILELNDEQPKNALKWYLIQNFNISNECWCDVSNLDSSPFLVVNFENSFMAKKYLESKAFDIDFVRNFEASWNDDMTEEFIRFMNHSPSGSSKSVDSSSALNRILNQFPDTQTASTVASKMSSHFLNRTFNTAANFDDNSFEDTDLHTLMLNTSLCHNTQSITQKRKRQEAKSSNKLPKSKWFLSEIDEPLKQNKALNQTAESVSLSSVCHTNLADQRCEAAVIEPAPPSTKYVTFERTQVQRERRSVATKNYCELDDVHTEDEELAYVSPTQAQSTVTSNASVSQSHCDEDIVEITDYINNNDNAIRRKSYVCRAKFAWKSKTACNYYLFCNKCPYRCTSRALFEKHKRCHLNNTEFKCNFCSYNASSIVAVKNHMHMHLRIRLTVAKDIKTES